MKPTEREVRTFVRYLKDRALLRSEVVQLSAALIAPKKKEDEKGEALSSETLLTLARFGLGAICLKELDSLNLATPERALLVEQVSKDQLHLERLTRVLHQLKETIPNFDDSFTLIKGLSIDEILYEGKKIRSSSDLDLLLNPSSSHMDLLNQLSTLGFKIRPFIRGLKRLGFQSIWSTHIEKGELQFDLHFSVRSHPAIQEPLNSLWERREYNNALSVFIPTLEDSQMITVLHLYFDLLNGKIMPRTLVDLSMFWSLKHSLPLPSHWDDSGLENILSFFELFLTELTLLRCEENIKEKPSPSYLDQLLELECKRNLFPLLDHPLHQSWLWWFLNLPMWILAYPESLSDKRVTASFRERSLY